MIAVKTDRRLAPARLPDMEQKMPVPVVSVTDLYHPYQDPGDNFDLIAAYGLPEIDLRAVVLDCTEPFRQPTAHPLPSPALFADTHGPRDPGFLAVTQLNYSFDRLVPCGTGPFRQMRAPDDPLADVPRFQQQGIHLILQTLQDSTVPVHIMSFGSARTIAAAYNRAPELFERNKTVIELSAGASGAAFLEWNVALDPHALVCLLRSPLTINLYPCATALGPFDLGQHNSFYSLASLSFIHDMAPPLRRYCQFAFSRSRRMDFLRALDEDWASPDADAAFAEKHSVWETALWQHVSGRVLARRPGERWQLASTHDAGDTAELLPSQLLPCSVTVNSDGLFSCSVGGPTDGTKRLYFRPDPPAQQAALNEALPDLYRSFLKP